MERDWKKSVCIGLQHTHPFGEPYYLNEGDFTISVIKRRKIRQIRSHHGVTTVVPRDGSAPCSIDQEIERIRLNQSGGCTETCDNCRRRVSVFASRNFPQK